MNRCPNWDARKVMDVPRAKRTEFEWHESEIVIVCHEWHSDVTKEQYEKQDCKQGSQNKRVCEQRFELRKHATDLNNIGTVSKNCVSLNIESVLFLTSA